jgi:S-adenosylmethionine hydrolase
VQAPVITFLSDYGYGDEFVGVCHGVIARRCPQARVIDIAHGIARQDIRAGALVLRDALAYMPAGVHLAVVDPTVGAGGDQSRRGVALATAAPGRMLVGPDNGLLWPAAEQLGGVARAVDLERSGERLQPVSATFHGRDVFAPVAAALAAGVPLEDVGEAIDPGGLRRLEIPVARIQDGVLVAHVLRSDAFGNLVLDASGAQLAEAGLGADAVLRVQAGGDRHPARRGRTFADVPAGELLLYEDSSGSAALAVNMGSAAALLQAEPDDEILIGTA